MQTSVLLVDDDTHQASKLHRAIQTQRPNWTVHVQSTWSDPVRFMAEHPVDVIVEGCKSDKPKQWLDKCERLFPFCVRLSSETVARQPKELVNQIEQSCGLQSHLHDPELRAIASQIDGPQSLTDDAISRLREEPVAGFGLDAYFEHARSVGQLAEAIAAVIEAPGDDDLVEVAQQALIAGTLHDVGKLVLATHRPEEFTEALALAAATGRPLWQAEVAVLGTTHAAIGAHLLCLWGYPRSLVDGVALHHQPSLCSHHRCPVLIAVHVADAMQRAVNRVDGNGNWSGLGGTANAQPEWDEEFLESRGLLGRVRRWAARIRR